MSLGGRKENRAASEILEAPKPEGSACCSNEHQKSLPVVAFNRGTSDDKQEQHACQKSLPPASLPLQPIPKQSMSLVVSQSKPVWHLSKPFW